MIDATVLGMPLLTAPDVEEMAQPVAAVLVVKSLDTDGEMAYRAMATDGLSTVEAIGMLRYGQIRLEARYKQPVGED